MTFLPNLQKEILKKEDWKKPLVPRAITISLKFPSSCKKKSSKKRIESVSVDICNVKLTPMCLQKEILKKEDWKLPYSPLAKFSPPFLAKRNPQKRGLKDQVVRPREEHACKLSACKKKSSKKRIEREYEVCGMFDHDGVTLAKRNPQKRGLKEIAEALTEDMLNLDKLAKRNPQKRGLKGKTSITGQRYSNSMYLQKEILKKEDWKTSNHRI